MDKPVIIGDTISIPSDLEYLADIDVFVEGILRGWGIDESVIADIAISVSELVNNAVNHGNKSAAEKSVSVSIAKKNSTAKICVTDQGGGFDPDQVESPIDDDNLMKEVGRGIFIVKSLMDAVDFDCTDNGLKITISKNL